ncbi:MAG: hypothetical protein AB7K86_08550 [Rhodospirillales bacterium]
MNRRNFMAGILAAATAPAFVRAGSLMRVDPRIVVPDPPMFLWDAEKYTGRFVGGRWNGEPPKVVVIGDSLARPLREVDGRSFERALREHDAHLRDGGKIVIATASAAPDMRAGLYRGRN